jgi:hypothetical protein
MESFIVLARINSGQAPGLGEHALLISRPLLAAQR